MTFSDLQVTEALAAAHAAGRNALQEGRVACYIPELAEADPGHLGLAVHLIDGRNFAIGDSRARFTLQSASKVFSLCRALKDGREVFDTMSVEPSGDAFFSIVKLEEEAGRPRNPYINAGAIQVTGLLPGTTAVQKSDAVRDFLAEASAGAIDDFPVDQAVFCSEANTGYRNRALAAIMRHHRTLGDAELAATAYFRQCAITTTAVRLARLGLFLANGGIDPLSARTILAPERTRMVLALMATCGMYDEVGRHAIEVGLPTKSAVSGAMIAVAPGRLTIAAYGPALGPKGNSAGGRKALAILAERLSLSLFG